MTAQMTYSWEQKCKCTGGLSGFWEIAEPAPGTPLYAPFCLECETRWALSQISMTMDGKVASPGLAPAEPKKRGRPLGQFRQPRNKKSRDKKCVTCGRDFTDASPTNSRKWCDDCSAERKAGRLPDLKKAAERVNARSEAKNE
jgi:hypothetical protein